MYFEEKFKRSHKPVLFGWILRQNVSVDSLDLMCVDVNNIIGVILWTERMICSLKSGELTDCIINTFFVYIATDEKAWLYEVHYQGSHGHDPSHSTHRVSSNKILSPIHYTLWEQSDELYYFV